MIKNKLSVISIMTGTFAFYTHAAETVNHQSSFLIKIECDSDNRAWVKQLRFHNGVDSIQTAFVDNEPVMCENGKFRVGSRLVSEKYLTDLYGRILSERKTKGGIPVQDPVRVLSACNELQSAKQYQNNADQMRHKELLQLCESYKKGL